MESERAAPSYLETMQRTVTGTYRSGIGMVRCEYKIRSSLNRVATHEFCQSTCSEITKIMSATMTKYVESATTINYDEVVRNKVGDDDV